MRFTAQQYQTAIINLQQGLGHLEPDGNNCTICGDSGHQAFECGFNPLYAMHSCQTVAQAARDFHETLHMLAGFTTTMGEPIGPSKVVMPDAVDEPTHELESRLQEIRSIIDRVENRCLAVDGPVSNTRHEMTDIELREIYVLAGGKIERDASASEQQRRR